MYRSPFDQDAIDDSLLNLYLRGSVASPGFMKPEGIVIHQLVAKVRHKWIIESDKASDRDYLSI